MSYDTKCYELAEYFFGSKDLRLQEIAQEIQDAIESFPSDHDGEIALQRSKGRPAPITADGEVDHGA